MNIGDIHLAFPFLLFSKLITLYHALYNYLKSFPTLYALCSVELQFNFMCFSATPISFYLHVYTPVKNISNKYDLFNEVFFWSYVCYQILMAA